MLLLSSNLLIQLLDLSNSYYTLKKYVFSTYYVGMHKFDRNINTFKLNLQETCWVQVASGNHIKFCYHCNVLPKTI